MARVKPFGARVTAALLAGACCAACSTQAGHRPAATVTVTRTPTPAGSSSTPSPTATPTPAATQRALPGDCDAMLSEPVVENALNRTLPGRIAFVVGVPEADIGRIGYVNCRYGLPFGAAAARATPLIEIGISLYKTPALAAKRIPATVDDFLMNGATSTTTSVGGVPATLLLGGAGAGYGPTIVLADGQRTVAVTMAPSATHNARADLTTLAALALHNSAP